MSSRERRRRSILVIVLVFVVFAGVISAAVRTPHNRGHTGELATNVLASMPIRASQSRSGYTRDYFSDGWMVIGGCDMRNRILQRDLGRVALAPDGCTVTQGTLRVDPYSGKAIVFVRGKSTSQAVQIDHIVAVSDAWQKGAQRLQPAQRAAFYNDPLNLIAVDGPTNMQKGDGDAAVWLPPDKAYRCRYVARQIAVKRKYDLWVTRAEYNAMQRVLYGCPDQIIPVAGGG